MSIEREEVPEGLPVEGRDRPAPRIPDLSPDETHALSPEQEEALRATGEQLADSARAGLAEVEPMRIGPAHTAKAPVDLVERLAETAWNASAPGMWRFIPEYRKDVHRAHVRAIIAELAAMGGEAMPDESEVFGGAGCASSADASRIVSFYKTRVAPILAAKDAEWAERARLEQIDLLQRVRAHLLSQLHAVSGERSIGTTHLHAVFDAELATLAKQANREIEALRDAATKEAEALRVENEQLREAIADIEANLQLERRSPKDAVIFGVEHQALIDEVETRTRERDAALKESEQLRAMVLDLHARISEGAEAFADAIEYLGQHSRDYDADLAKLRGEDGSVDAGKPKGEP